MKHIEFHLRTKVEYESAIRWYESERVGLGGEFREEVEAILARILENPELFGFVSENNRLARVHRFRYGIIYQIRGENIFVLAIAHLHRHPEYWKDRG